MSKKSDQELALVKQSLTTAENTAKYWQAAHDREYNSHKETKRKHGENLAKLVQNHHEVMDACAREAAHMLDRATLQAERDTMSRAFQHLADNLTRPE